MLGLIRSRPLDRWQEPGSRYCFEHHADDVWLAAQRNPPLGGQFRRLKFRQVSLKVEHDLDRLLIGMMVIVAV